MHDIYIRKVFAIARKSRTVKYGQHRSYQLVSFTVSGFFFVLGGKRKASKPKVLGTLFFTRPAQVSRTTLQPSARTVIFPVSRTNSTIIQVKAACDGDNMRIVAELNTNTILQYRLDCIKQMVADVFPMETFAQRHFKHYSFQKLHVLLLLLFSLFSFFVCWCHSIK